MRCDTLWTIIIGSLNPLVSNLLQNLDSSSRAAQRLCLVNCSSRSISLCMIAFKVYHALKMDWRGLVDKAVLEEDFGDVWKVTLDLIAHFKGEFYF